MIVRPFCQHILLTNSTPARAYALLSMHPEFSRRRQLHGKLHMRVGSSADASISPRRGGGGEGKGAAQEGRQCSTHSTPGTAAACGVPALVVAAAARAAAGTGGSSSSDRGCQQHLLVMRAVAAPQYLFRISSQSLVQGSASLQLPGGSVYVNLQQQPVSLLITVAAGILFLHANSC